MLKPAADLTDPGADDMMGLLADSTPVVDALGNNRWKLLVDVRRDVLRALGGHEGIQQALGANPDRSRDDPVPRASSRATWTAACLPWTSRNIVQVAATFEVAQWLRGLDVQLGSPMPDLGGHPGEERLPHAAAALRGAGRDEFRRARQRASGTS